MDKYQSPGQLYKEGKSLWDLLQLGLLNLDDFGNDDQIVRQYFFNLSELAEKNNEMNISSIALDLMLYVEGVETSTYATMTCSEIKQQLKNK